VRHFDVIHSVDRISLARALDKEAARRNKPQAVLLQANIGHETSKGGCAPEEVAALAVRCAEYSHLRVLGLMALPPYSADPEASRPYFRRMRELLEEARQSTPALGDRFRELSMGMSRDFEVAIEEGATMVRLGTVLFGERAA
jgi:pyridoxal phosphate enzyme (YggS family)